MPQERVDKAQAKIEALIAGAVEKGDTRALQVFKATWEADSRKHGRLQARLRSGPARGGEAEAITMKEVQ